MYAFVESIGLRPLRSESESESKSELGRPGRVDIGASRAGDATGKEQELG